MHDHPSLSPLWRPGCGIRISLPTAGLPPSLRASSNVRKCQTPSAWAHASSTAVRRVVGGPRKQVGIPRPPPPAAASGAVGCPPRSWIGQTAHQDTRPRCHNSPQLTSCDATERPSFGVCGATGATVSVAVGLGFGTGMAARRRPTGDLLRLLCRSCTRSMILRAAATSRAHRCPGNNEPTHPAPIPTPRSHPPTHPPTALPPPQGLLPQFCRLLCFTTGGAEGATSLRALESASSSWATSNAFKTASYSCCQIFMPPATAACTQKHREAPRNQLSGPAAPPAFSARAALCTRAGVGQVAPQLPADLAWRAASNAHKSPQAAGAWQRSRAHGVRLRASTNDKAS